MRTNSRRWMRSTSPLSAIVSEPAFCARERAAEAVDAAAGHHLDGHLVADQPRDALVLDGQRDGDAAEASLRSIGRGQHAEVHVADDDVLARRRARERTRHGLISSGKQLLRERGGVGGASRPSREQT